MYAVAVTFEIATGQMDRFLPLMTKNARTSKELEEGCRYFDICRDQNTVFLYEVYDSRAAFDLHLSSDHFATFDAAVSDIITSKQVKTFDEVIQ